MSSLASFARSSPPADPTSPSGWLRARSNGEATPESLLFHAPSTAFQAPGGGENQLIQTGRHLEAMGLPVRPFSPWVDRLADHRLLHLFGMSREGLELARSARRQGTPVVVSPICWFEPAALARLGGHPIKGLLDAAKWSLKGIFPGLPSWRGELLEIADLVLPNSRAEARQLVRLFRIDPARIRVIPNGVEPRFAEADPGPYRARFGREDFVLYVGRIEPRKNVRTLAEAARLAGLPLTVIGRVPPGQEDYAAACRRAAGPLARFLSAMAHDDPMLASAYAAARVFALPSWFETPGLAALEAGLAGAAIVITPNGCTREYFSDGVIYAPPDRPREIAHALSEAWSEGPRLGLAARLRARYPWTEVARRTAEAYDHVLE